MIALATARTPAGQGAEAGPLHRVRRRRRQPPITAPGQVAWLLIYPDTYEIGLPNQGLQILYEILNERADAVAERAYAPWIDLEALLRARRPAAVLGRHAPPGGRLRPARLQPVGRARLHQRPQLHRPGRRARCAAADRRPEHPLVVAGGHCTYNPEPLADFVDFFVLGDGEEVVGEITEVVREWKASGRTEGSPRAGAAPRWPRSRASTCRRCTRSTYDGADLVGVTPRYPDVPGAGREAHDRRPGRLALPQAPARAAHRGRPRPAQRRGVPGLHPGLPLLPGRHDHPPGPRAPGRPGPDDGARRPAPHRLRRGEPHVAVDGRLLAASSGSSPTRSTTRPAAATIGVSLPSLRVDAFTVGIAAQVAEGPPHRPHLRPRGRHVAACARSSTS